MLLMHRYLGLWKTIDNFQMKRIDISFKTHFFNTMGLQSMCQRKRSQGGLNWTPFEGEVLLSVQFP